MLAIPTRAGGPGCAAGCDGNEPQSFWDTGRGFSGLGRQRGSNQQPGYDWQNLPRMLGDNGRGNDARGGPYVSDFLMASPDNIAQIRQSTADISNGSITNIGFGAEVATADRRTAFGVIGGLGTANGGSAALSPAIYGKRVLRASENGMCGIGLGGSFPVGSSGTDGSLFPWLFATHRVTGDIWGQGSASVVIPFSGANDFATYLDYGWLVPIPVRFDNAQSVRLYFMPELHANFPISRGDGNTTFAGSSELATDYGNPGFVLNTTLGFGVRTGGVDAQFGVAIPILDNRYYSYETVFRVSYRY